MSRLKTKTRRILSPTRQQFQHHLPDQCKPTLPLSLPLVLLQFTTLRGAQKALLIPLVLMPRLFAMCPVALALLLVLYLRAHPLVMPKRLLSLLVLQVQPQVWLLLRLQDVLASLHHSRSIAASLPLWLLLLLIVLLHRTSAKLQWHLLQSPPQRLAVPVPRCIVFKWISILPWMMNLSFALEKLLKYCMSMMMAG